MQSFLKATMKAIVRCVLGTVLRELIRSALERIKDDDGH